MTLWTPWYKFFELGRRFLKKHLIPKNSNTSTGTTCVSLQGQDYVPNGQTSYKVKEFTVPTRPYPLGGSLGPHEQVTTVNTQAQTHQRDDWAERRLYTTQNRVTARAMPTSPASFGPDIIIG
jgi:hypothetical protein